MTNHKDLQSFIQSVRDHYVEQFRIFTTVQTARLDSSSRPGVEIKFDLPGETGVFKNLAIVDFCAVREDGIDAVEMQPDTELTFEPFSAAIGNASVDISWIRWDSVNIEIGVDPPIEALEHWFDAWFDPDDERYDPASEFSNCIHRVFIDRKELTVDFGTAPVDAFWHLMDLLVREGDAARIRIYDVRD